MKNLVCEFWGVLKDKICAFIDWIFELFHAKKNETEKNCKPFIVSDYLDRMEKLHLEILEQKKPVDKTIILWWGMDGLRLNDDGTLEWISRKKPGPIRTDKQNPSYQSQNAIALFYNQIYHRMQSQCTQAQIDSLRDQNGRLCLQASHMAQNLYITQTLSKHHPYYEPPNYLPQYAGAWRVTGYSHFLL